MRVGGKPVHTHPPHPLAMFNPDRLSWQAAAIETIRKGQEEELSSDKITRQAGENRRAIGRADLGRAIAACEHLEACLLAQV